MVMEVWYAKTLYQPEVIRLVRQMLKTYKLALKHHSHSDETPACPSLVRNACTMQYEAMQQSGTVLFRKPDLL